MQLLSLCMGSDWLVQDIRSVSKVLVDKINTLTVTGMGCSFKLMEYVRCNLSTSEQRLLLCSTNKSKRPVR